MLLKKISTCFLLFVMAVPVFSQNHFFEKAFGTSGNDFSRSVKQLADGSIYVFGNTDSGTYGANDLSLTKLDQDGNQLWTKYYGTPNSENGLYLNTTADHHFIFTGESVTSSGGDILFYKVDTSGIISWNKTYATALNESGNYIEQTKDGGYIIAGMQTDSTGHNDFFVLKVNDKGEDQWHRSFGTSRNEYAKCIREINNGFILVGDIDDSLANYNVGVYRLDTLGKEVWFKNYGDSLANGSQGILCTSDGNYLFFGETEISQGSAFDGFLEKIDTNGTVLWKHNYGGTNSDAVFSVVETTDGGFACTGYSNSYTSNKPLDLLLFK